MQLNYLKKLLSLKFDLNIWSNLLNQLFPKVELFTSPAKVTDSSVKTGGHIGNIRLDDGRSLAIFSFEVIDNILIARNRKGLREIAAKYIDQSLIHGALVFYYSANQDDYRLTFIAKQTFFNENGELEKKETAPKRYTFLLGPNEPCTTAAKRLLELFDKKSKGSIYLVDVVETFSVERLNKEFFTGYKAQYTKFIKQLPESKRHRDYVKKLLGRLVFLQFLQKKGWMGVPASNTKWEGGDKEYLLHLIERHQGNDFLLSNVLEPLFFNTLNEPRTNDLANCILGENIKIPYLNGGLFEEDELDKMRIDFSYDFFKELIHFFSQYNFTIDENDPDDSEVGIDPEMLGHIFENLLEDNKDKGAFYTPKEIVQYMSRQSIIQYLKTYITEEKYASAIDTLVNTYQIEPILQNKEMASRLITLLQNVKVCDPAIGSGAFPMGVMNVLFHTRHTLHAFADKHGSWNAAQVKREIIQNNIFGVDIEQGAVDIARLRFWLALVVDADTPQPLPNLDYKITCGNSLLSRYAIDAPIENVFVEYNKDKPEEDKMSFAKYKQFVNDFTNSSDHVAKEEFRETIESIKNAFKVELSNQFKHKLAKLRGKISTLEAPMLFGERAKSELKELKKLKIQLNKLEQEQDDILSNQLYSNAFEWRFEFPQLLDENGMFTGFDIVIGNPPYLRIQGIRDTNPAFAEELVKKYRSATGSFDLYAAFAERGLQVIRQSGLVNYIMPDKWTNAAFGKGLREVVSAQKAAYKIISFGAYQVFNASTYTALQWFKPNSENLEYYQLDRNLGTNQELDIYLKSIKCNNASIINAEKLDKNSWVLTVGATSTILQELESHPRRISDIFDKIFQGLATSKDDVYFLYDCIENNDNIIGYSKQLDRIINIEKGLVKPLLKGEDVHRYDNIQTNRSVIFPYKLNNGKAVLYSEKELSVLFPNGYSYLKECEDILRNREKGRFNIDGGWFQYGRKQGILSAEKEKLVAPDISMGGNFAHDVEGKFYQTTTIYGYIKKSEISENYKFWMALLNSRLCWWFLTNTGTTLANGFFRFKPDYIKLFPVPEHKQTNKGEKLIVKLTEFILYLYDKNNDDILTHTTNKRLATHIEEIIDMIFYELYFEQLMKDNHIDVISDLNNYEWSNISDASTIESFYKWYQQSENMVRQKIMLLDTRSRNFIYLIHRNATL